MTGAFLAVGPCVSCRSSFSFNPSSVPSLTSDDGVRRPVCGECVPLLNAELERQGRAERLTILPGSYEMEQP